MSRLIGALTLLAALSVCSCGSAPATISNVLAVPQTAASPIPGSDPQLGAVTGPKTGILHPTLNTAHIVDDQSGTTICLKADNSALPDGTHVSYYIQAAVAIDVTQI